MPSLLESSKPVRPPCPSAPKARYPLRPNLLRSSWYRRIRIMAGPERIMLPRKVSKRLEQIYKKKIRIIMNYNILQKFFDILCDVTKNYWTRWIQSFFDSLPSLLILWRKNSSGLHIQWHVLGSWHLLLIKLDPFQELWEARMTTESCKIFSFQDFW